MRTVALDLGSKKIAFCEVAAGQVVARATVTHLSSLEQWLGPKRPAAKVAIEACEGAWHVHDVLTRWGHQVLLVDTTRSRQLGIGQHGRKTDRLDAETLARAVEREAIPAAHVLSPQRREVRRQLRVRRALIATRADFVVQVRGLVREHGEHLASCDTDQFLVKVSKTALSATVRALIEPLLQVLQSIEAQLALVDQSLGALLVDEPVVARLVTVPGVGAVIAAAFISVVDDAQRFRNAHQVESYLGLVPSESSSGGRRRLGGISKKGNSYLRALLVQTAWVIIRKSDPDDPLRTWAQALAKRRGQRIAIVALARRLVGVLWAIWRDGTTYDPASLGHAAARGHRRAAATLQTQVRTLEQAAQSKRRLRRFLPKTCPREVTVTQ